MSGPLPRLRNVSLSFSGVKALNALAFEAARGKICAPIGPDGAGKSSLLNVFNGVYRAEAGEVVFDGARFGALRPPRRPVSASAAPSGTTRSSSGRP